MAHVGSGRLIERVAWDVRTPADDGHGGARDRYSQQFDCRAEFIPLRGGEAILSARLVGRQPIVVRVRNEVRTIQIAHGWRMRDLHKGSWAGTGPDLRWLGTVYFVKSVSVSKESRLFLDILVESEGAI